MRCPLPDQALAHARPRVLLVGSAASRSISSTSERGAECWSPRFSARIKATTEVDFELEGADDGADDGAEDGAVDGADDGADDVNKLDP